MIENLISGILTVLVFGALVWAFPTGAKNQHGTLDPSLDEATLKRLYRRAEWLAIPVLFLWVGLCTWAISSAFYLFAFWIVTLFNNAPYRILPPLESWFSLGIILGLACLKNVIDGVIRFVMGQKAVDAHNIMMERLYDFNVAKAGRWFRKVLIVLAIALTIFTIDTRIDIYPDRFIFNNFCSLFWQRTVPFDTLSSITVERDTVAEKAIFPSNPVYSLHFKDGTIWESNWSDFGSVVQALNFVAAQKGIVVDTVMVR